MSIQRCVRSSVEDVDQHQNVSDEQTQIVAGNVVAFAVRVPTMMHVAIRFVDHLQDQARGLRDGVLSSVERVVLGENICDP